MLENKRVNIILVRDIEEGKEEDGSPIVIKAGTRMLRTTRSYAERLIRETNGVWAYSTKSKLKSFLRKDVKLSKNMRTLEFSQNLTGENYPERRVGGKIIADVPTFKVSKPEPVKRTIRVRRLINRSKRSAVDGIVKTYKKSDTSRFFVADLKEEVKYKPNKATIADRNKGKKEEDINKKKLSGTGYKRIILAY